MLWEIEITSKTGSDRDAEHALAEACLRRLDSLKSVRSARSYLVEGELDEQQIQRAARLLSDRVVEQVIVRFRV